MTTDYERGWRDAIEAAAKRLKESASQIDDRSLWWLMEDAATEIRSLTPPAPSAPPVESGTAHFTATPFSGPERAPASTRGERCPTCQGSKMIADGRSAFGCSTQLYPCPACGGTGRTKGGE